MPLSLKQFLRILIRRGLRSGWLHVILVEVVCFEEFLHAVTAQLGLAFTYCLRIFPLLIIDMICVEVVNVDVGDIW